MVWEDWAEILRANPWRAMLNWGRHNAQCLPVWKQSGPMLSAGCAHVGPSRAHVEPSSWAQLGLMLGQVGPMLSHRAHLGPICWAHLGPMLGPCWAYVGPMLAYVGPMLARVEPSWALRWGHVWAIYVETLLRCHFFCPEAQHHLKTDVFQHRRDDFFCRRRARNIVKNDVFWHRRQEDTVNHRSFSWPGVPPGVNTGGSAAGGAAPTTFGYHREAGKDTGCPRGRRPDLEAYAWQEVRS